MCGRLNITTDPLARWLQDALGLQHPGPDNPNAAPMETIAVVRAGPLGDPEIAPLRWWLLPHWSPTSTTRYSMFNARSESLASSPAFREPFHRRRCVVPVSGFYEWTRSPSGKIPWYIASSPASDDVAGLLLAGVWDRWHEPNGTGVLDSFAIVTTTVHPGLAFVHDRQPVMLTAAGARHWIDPATPTTALEDLLVPELPGPLSVVPVSTRVNNARHKAPDCCAPVGPPRLVP